MKLGLILPILFLFLTGAWAQMQPIKVVFDISSKDPDTHQSAMRHVTMMANAYPDSEFEVVVYGKGMDMVLKEKSTVANEILRLKDLENVYFKICGETLKRHHINQNQLISGVETVPDGILEIVTKQAEGWGYIKESHN